MIKDTTKNSNENIEVKTTICGICADHRGIKVTLNDAEMRYIHGGSDHSIKTFNEISWNQTFKRKYKVSTSR